VQTPVLIAQLLYDQQIHRITDTGPRSHRDSVSPKSTFNMNICTEITTVGNDTGK